MDYDASMVYTLPKDVYKFNVGSVFLKNSGILFLIHSSLSPNLPLVRSLFNTLLLNISGVAK